MCIMPRDGTKDYKRCKRHRGSKSIGENKAHTEQANDNTSNVILHDKISYRDNDFIKPINYKLVNILN